MFNLTISKSELLPRLLMVAGAVDKRQSGAILASILFCLGPDRLRLTATDLEIEISADIACSTESSEGKMTVPAKKFIDIIRSLDDGIVPVIQLKNEALIIKANRSQFRLTTLPADDFPSTKQEESDISFSLPRTELIHLLHVTHFAMAQQDVRFYLNGLLFEFDGKTLTTVATDGHRMAICKLICPCEVAYQRYLLPRKGVLEMLRLLNAISDEMVTLMAGKNHIGLITADYHFNSKLIEARFPPYVKAIPIDNDKIILVDNHELRRSLSRIIILANEKSRAVLLHMQPNVLTLIANNQEQEEATESLEAQIEGDEIKIGINASYLLDVLTIMPDGLVEISLSTADRSVLVKSMKDEQYLYIIMPMTL